MASFTDKEPKFNPYVAQQPVDAMVKVGMHKQAQYDRGYQKIQSSIDKVAGLELTRDVDKDYLNSKLSSLKSNLSTVAGGDFSNAQLTNSIAGMANKVGNDSTIIDSVRSTMKYKKESSVISADIEAGTDNPNNTLRFNKDSQAWLNGEKAGEQYKATYFKPVDVYGKMVDILKDIDPKDKSFDQPYVTDNQGNVLYDKDNQPQYNMVMIKKTLKGKNAGRILAAWKLGLTAQDKRQLSIDGEGNWANKGEQELGQMIQNRTTEQIRLADVNLTGLNIELESLNNNPKATDERKESITSQIELFTQLKADYEKSGEANMANLSTNLDGVRGSLYTNQYLSKMSQVLSSEESSTLVEDNPGFKNTMVLNRFNRDTERDRVADRKWNIEMQFKADKFQYTKDSDAADRKNEAEGVTNMYTDAALDTENLDTIKYKKENDYSESIKNMNANNMKLAKIHFQSLPGNENKSDQEIFDIIKEKAKKNGYELNMKEGVEDFTSMVAAAQLLKWKSDPKNIEPSNRALYAMQDGLNKDLSVQKLRIEKVKKEALIIAKNRGILFKDPLLYNDNVKAQSVLLETGEQINLTQQNVEDFIIHRNLNLDLDKNKNAPSTRRLKDKYGVKFMEIQKAFIGNVNLTTADIGKNPSFLTDAGSAFFSPTNNSRDFVKARKYLIEIDNTPLDKIEGELYEKNGFYKLPKRTGLVQLLQNSEEKLKVEFKNLASEIFENNSKNFDEKSFQKALLNTGKTAVGFLVTPGNRGEMSISMQVKTSDGQTKTMTITEQEYLNIQGPSVSLPSFDRDQTVVAYAEDFGTSNTSISKKDPRGAWFSASSLPLLKDENFNYTADLIQDSTIKDQFFFKLYKSDKDGKFLKSYNIEIPYYKSQRSEALEVLRKISPVNIKAIEKGK